MDFSDARLRFIRLREDKHGLVPTDFAEVLIPSGCMQGGKIIDQAKFTSFLKDVNKKYNLEFARVSIPESQVYSFTLSVDIAARDDIRGSIELVLEDNVPLKAVETIFDFQVLSSDQKAIVVHVVALSETVATAYLTACTAAGITPVSFELDGQAVARAVLTPGDDRSCMIVDIGSSRTAITIVSNGSAVYTSTLEFGGNELIETIKRDFAITDEEAHQIIHMQGFTGVEEKKQLFNILSEGTTMLKEEINKRYIYWHEKKDQHNKMPAIDTIYLCGGYSTIRGLTDYLSAELKLSVVQVNPWTNCMSFETHIPSIDHDEAQSYVTAIGLVLADYIYD